MAKSKKHLFGVVTVGEKGQIVIPKKARDLFGIVPGSTLLVLGDEGKGGIAIVKTEFFSDITDSVLGSNDDDN